MSDEPQEHKLGAIDFKDANLLFNLLMSQNDKAKDSEVIGIALYKHRETGMGRVIFKGTSIDEEVWKQIMVNAQFLMDEGETSLKVCLIPNGKDNYLNVKGDVNIWVKK